MPSFKVLVVDDSAAFRQVVCSMLQQTTQFQVVGQARDGLEAIQKAEESQVDVILLDIGLPRLNGIDAARRISLVAPRSKILFLSQLNDPDIVKSALSDGAYGYVLKSQASRELLAALASVVRGERYVSHKLASAMA